MKKIAKKENIVSKVGSKVGNMGASENILKMIMKPLSSISPTSSISNKIKMPKNYMPNIKRKGGSIKAKKKK